MVLVSIRVHASKKKQWKTAVDMWISIRKIQLLYKSDLAKGTLLFNYVKYLIRKTFEIPQQKSKNVLSTEEKQL